MAKIGSIALADHPAIAAVIVSGENTNAAAIKAKEQGAQIIELRFDLFSDLSTDYLSAAIDGVKKSGLPIIATVRSKREGGANYINDEVRLQLFNDIIPQVSAVDIELSARSILPTVVAQAHQHQKTVIISYHNFDITPSKRELAIVIRAAKTRGADIVKLAAKANSNEDLIALLQVTLKYREQQLISCSMGPHGVASRVFFLFLGSLLTYGYIDEPQAPGQLAVTTLHEELVRYMPDYLSRNEVPR